jgi:hypothetical protein
MCYAGSFTVSRDHLTPASLNRNSTLQLLQCLGVAVQLTNRHRGGSFQLAQQT